jgi:hypothetical protein
MLKYQLETEIHKPLDQVTRLFSNRALLAKWQPGLLSSEQIETYPHTKYKLMFEFGRRKMAMTETILRNELPMHFDGTYEMKGVFNRIYNSFEATGPDKTLWVCNTEFRFTGLMSLVAFFMKGNFKKQSAVIMSNFKRFAEAH